MTPELAPALPIGVALLLGLAVGSFLNVVIHRLPKMLDAEWRAQCAELAGGETCTAPVYNLAVPRSACPHCGHRLTVLENIPVLSWLFLRGRCSACLAPIGLRYPLVELFTGLVSAAVVWQFGTTVAGLGALLLAWFLIALAGVDLDTQFLPDDLTLPLLWLGLAFNLGGAFVSLADAVIGAMAGYLALWTIYWLFRLATGREGMGYGDFKLLAALGAWLGWQMLPLVVLLSSVVGALVGLTMITLVRHDHRIPIPFGPYLAGGGLVALFFGKALLAAWLGGV